MSDRDTNDELRGKIVRVLREVAEQSGAQLDPNLGEDSILLESGLDSLGFAIAVVRLEMQLGYDPFRRMTQPIYPRTLRDFVECYASFRRA